jgi:hypothetical protein
MLACSPVNWREIAFSLIDPEWVPILSLRKGLGVLKSPFS